MCGALFDGRGQHRMGPYLEHNVRQETLSSVIEHLSKRIHEAYRLHHVSGPVVRGLSSKLHTKRAGREGGEELLEKIWAETLVVGEHFPRHRTE